MISATSHPQVIPAHNASGSAMERTTAHRGTPRVFCTGLVGVDTPGVATAGVVVAVLFVAGRRRPTDLRGRAAVVTRPHLPQHSRSS